MDQHLKPDEIGALKNMASAVNKLFGNQQHVDIWIQTPNGPQEVRIMRPIVTNRLLSAQARNAEWLMDALQPLNVPTKEGDLQAFHNLVQEGHRTLLKEFHEKLGTALSDTKAWKSIRAEDGQTAQADKQAQALREYAQENFTKVSPEERLAIMALHIRLTGCFISETFEIGRQAVDEMDHALLQIMEVGLYEFVGRKQSVSCKSGKDRTLGMVAENNGVLNLLRNPTSELLAQADPRALLNYIVVQLAPGGQHLYKGFADAFGHDVITLAGAKRAKWLEKIGGVIDFANINAYQKAALFFYGAVDKDKHWIKKGETQESIIGIYKKSSVKKRDQRQKHDAKAAEKAKDNQEKQAAKTRQKEFYNKDYEDSRVVWDTVREIRLGLNPVNETPDSENEYDSSDDESDDE
jgi:hypothetical protein